MAICPSKHAPKTPTVSVKSLAKPSEHEDAEVEEEDEEEEEEEEEFVEEGWFERSIVKLLNCRDNRCCS